MIRIRADDDDHRIEARLQGSASCNSNQRLSAPHCQLLGGAKAGGAACGEDDSGARLMDGVDTPVLNVAHDDSIVRWQELAGHLLGYGLQLSAVSLIEEDDASCTRGDSLQTATLGQEHTQQAPLR